jgi:hypothetical protein
MNIARGLFRGWIVVSSLWVAGVVTTAAFVVPQDISYPYWQYSAVLTDNGKTNPFDRDWSAPFYTNFRSPSAYGRNPDFGVLDYQYRAAWDKDVAEGRTALKLFPDGSRLYLMASMSEQDKDYVSDRFWSARWGRWGMEIGKWFLIAVCPVATLFILGYAAIWIGRGFQSA